VPEVLGWDDATLVVSWVPTGRADAAVAERFGRDLARMHRAGAPSFGAPWPGFIASLPLPNDHPAPPADSAGRDPWPDWYTARRGPRRGAGPAGAGSRPAWGGGGARGRGTGGRGG